MKKLTESPNRRLPAAGCFVVACLLCGVAAFAQTRQTVTWAGGNTYSSYNNTNNWSPKIIPVNTPDTNFTVIVPQSTSFTLDMGGPVTIDALEFRVGAAMDIQPSNSLDVAGAALIRGAIQAAGAGSMFRALGPQTVLMENPRLTALQGGQILVSGSTFSWANFANNATLLYAANPGSLVSAANVSSMTLNYGDGGSWTYAIGAADGGTVDLSGLGVATGPGSDDWLEFKLGNGGLLRLDSLRRTSNRVRFRVSGSAQTLPALLGATDTWFNVGTNAALTLPACVSLSGGAINLDPAAQFQSDALQWIANAPVSLSPNSSFHSPSLNTFTGAAISISNNAVFETPGLQTLDTVPINLSGSGTFLATNLTTYRNTDIPVYPGRNAYFGLLSDIYASRIWVTDGAQFIVRASTYDTPADWRWSPTLFSADGDGSLLDMAAMKTMRVRYGAGYGYTYTASANNSAVIDLSALESITGPDESDDWLVLKVRNGGRIRLDSLREVVRQVRFDIGDGDRVDAPSLTSLNGCSFAWGFNSTFNAPQLRSLTDSTLALVPGPHWEVPALTNIYASRLAVSGGVTGHVAAVSYDTPADWRLSPTLFSADGDKSLLDMAAMKTMRVRYGSYRECLYSASANNGGVIDLSALESITGPEETDDWLVLQARNGGRIWLDSLREVIRQVRFDTGDGDRVDAPSLTSLNACSFVWGFDSTFNAPQLRSLTDSTLALVPGVHWEVPALTNIYASRLSVSGGVTGHVAAVSYDTPADWRLSPILFSADGDRSLLDMAAMQTMRVRYGAGYGYTYTGSANNGGVIDLSALESITGPEEGDDWLVFSADNGGMIKLGNALASRQIRMSVASVGSRLRAAGLYLAGAVTLSATGKGSLVISGDFRYQNTNANDIVVEGAYFQMDGAQPQRLEVGGRDLGASGSSVRNFGYSQLIVGSSNQTSVVRLVDTINNGNRGAGGDSEALYLYGMDAAGLRILNGSRLVLNGLNAYALVNGQMRRLGDLIPPGTNSVAFDGGFLANSGGPRITNMTPSIAVTPSVSSVNVSFDIPIEAASFTPSDVSITGPSGAIPATGVALMSGTTWRVSFAPQATDGTYTVKVGPAINEVAANLPGMDQNGDGLGGDGTNDIFTGTFIIDGTPPSVIGAYGLQNGNCIGVTFNEPVTAAFATNSANYTTRGLDCYVCFGE